MGVAQRLSATDRKAAIVDAAIRVFSEKGFRGTTTRELSAAAGVSEPVIYQHFATKSELYAAIIEAKSQAVAGVMADLVHFLDTNDDRAFLRHLATTILEYYEQDPAYLRILLFSGLERHEFADLFHERYSTAFFQAVVNYIAQRIDQGVIRPLNPVLVAHSFLSMVAHVGTLRMLGTPTPGELTQDQFIDGMVDIFLKGIQNDAE